MTNRSRITLPAHLFLSFLVLLVVGNSASAQGKRVELFDESIGFSFVPPVGLSSMSKDAMSAVFDGSSAMPPRFAFADKNQEVFVAIGDFGENATENELAEMKKFLETHVDKTYPQREWFERSWVIINDKRWFRLKFRVAGGGKDVVNDYYVTDWLGRYVLFNFSSMTAKYESHRSDIDRSVKTIRLSMVAVAPVRRTTRKRRSD